MKTACHLVEGGGYLMSKEKKANESSRLLHILLVFFMDILFPVEDSIRIKMEMSTSQLKNHTIAFTFFTHISKSRYLI